MFRISVQLSSLCFLVALVGCSGKQTPAYNPDVGPFDEDGNYIEAWADNPPSRKSKKRKTSKPTTKPDDRVAILPKSTGRPKPIPARPATPKPKPISRPTPKPKPKPKPKPVVVKPKKIRHTVKKGDTLYSLSRKYGVSVSAIQKANSLNGNLIRVGGVLVIPK